MKYSAKLVIVLFFSFFTISNVVIGENFENKTEIKEKNNSLTNIFDLIKICKWKNDASTCINFSFDDNNYSHKKIAEILDQYGFKGTFFVISSYLFTDYLKYISDDGHEIGNHTFSHMDLTTLDSLDIDFQIRKGKELIENALGIKCVSFAEPGHSKSQLDAKIAFQYCLFDREYSEYPKISYILLPYTGLTIASLTASLDKAVNSGSILEISGHGLDGEGYNPITTDFFKQTLNLVKQYVENKRVWVTTVKEGGQYQNLYHELHVDKTIKGDTLTINFKNFNINKYQDLDASPISIEIPYTLCDDIKCLTESAEVKKMVDKYLITTDLMSDTTLILTSRKLSDLTTDTVNRINKKFIVFPNPVSDILNIQNLDDISLIEIFNSEGKLLLSLTDKAFQLDVSQLKSGLYFIKVITGSNNSNFVYRSKFLKI